MLRINALDTLFFRDGKPFTMGQESGADVVFPPYPSVLHGALRTAAFFGQNETFMGSDLIDQATSKLRINQFFLEFPDAQSKHYFFPLPLDFFISKSSDDNRVHLGMLLRNESSNNTTEYLVVPGGGGLGESASRMYLKAGELQKYIQGTLSELRAKPLQEFFDVEEKTGNGRNDQTNSVEEGLLYSLQMVRPKANFIVDVESQLPLDNLLTRIGGEGKMAHATKQETGINFSAPLLKEHGQMVKLYLATPGIFPGTGWKPDLSQELIAGFSPDFNPHPVAACVGKYLPLGGFDQKANQPKSMLRAVPAGSVYYYAGPPDHINYLLALHGKSICEEPYASQGFGITYCALLHADQQLLID